MENVIINNGFANLVNYENISSDNNHNVYYESTSKNDSLSSIIRDSQVIYYSFGQNESDQKPASEIPTAFANVLPLRGI